MKPIDILTQALELVAALTAAPLFVGWVNQCRAWLQNRSAPSIWLPYRGIRKLFHKDAVIAESASPLFRVAPYIVFGAMVVAAGIIPSMGTRLPFTIAADAIALVGLLATARVFLALAAMDIGTYGMPMIVEFGVALDVLVAVLVLGIFFFQIREQFDSLDLHHLESLRESQPLYEAQYSAIETLPVDPTRSLEKSR
jgi:formate hydrogenlyase subunit 4